MSEWVYDAFISYSHKDLDWGRNVQKWLEGYTLPKDLRKESGVQKPLRIFRDQTDLAGAELGASLRREMDHSRYLLVICSPNSAQSKWVNEEIRYFKSIGRRANIIPLIVAGEPFSDKPEMECFPPALREKGEEEDDLLGASVPEIGKKNAFLKVASILLDVRFDRMVKREKKRKRIVRSIAAAALTAAVALIVVTLITRIRNLELSKDVYAAAMSSFAQTNELTPEGFELIRTSAEAGNEGAMLILADCYKRGWGTEVQPEQAFRWYMKAAERGNLKGMQGVANCYVEGFGTEKDLKLALDWQMKAAEAGDTDAMLYIARSYEDGEIVEKDPAKAFELFKKAAEAGNAKGMYDLAGYYMNGAGGVMDEKQAFAWMQKLAQAGDANAMYWIGMMYEAGYGVEKDPGMSYRCYRAAAEAGQPTAMRMTGWCIENQFGTVNQALEWYQRAVDAGYADAAADVERLRKGNESVPAQIDETAMSKVDESLPAEVDETDPSKVDESVPAKDDETAPSKVDESVPSN